MASKHSLDLSDTPPSKKPKLMSVNCERGFSRQNLIKTALRNSMSTHTLNNLLAIGINGQKKKRTIKGLLGFGQKRNPDIFSIK